MEDRTEITRNQTALNYQLVWFSLCYMVLGAVSIILLLVPFNFMEDRFILWALIITGLAIIFYVLSIWALKKTWASTKYYLTKDCLVVKNGYKSTREDIFRYDTITTVSVKQKTLEKQRGYGKILVNVPEQQSPVILKDISNPTEAASSLQNNIVGATRKNFSV